MPNLILNGYYDYLLWLKVETHRVSPWWPTMLYIHAEGVATWKCNVAKLKKASKWHPHAPLAKSMVARVQRRDMVRSFVIWGELRVGPLLLCIESSPFKWFGHLLRMSPGCLSLVRSHWEETLGQTQNLLRELYFLWPGITLGSPKGSWRMECLGSLLAVFCSVTRPPISHKRWRWSKKINKLTFLMKIWNTAKLAINICQNPTCWVTGHKLKQNNWTKAVNN